MDSRRKTFAGRWARKAALRAVLGCITALLTATATYGQPPNEPAKEPAKEAQPAEQVVERKPAEKKPPAAVVKIAGGGLEPAVVIRVEGEIDPLFRETMLRRFEEAKRQKAKLVILEIDSPGGRVVDSFALANFLLSQREIKTVAYIRHQALSGASFLALACDEIVMHPTARMGDAGAIYQDEGGMFRFAPQKLTSDLATQVRQIAEARGRPPALAEAMVDKSAEVFHVTHRETQRETMMTEAEIRSSPEPDVWIKGPLVLESRDEHFFEVTGARAVELKLASAVARDNAELIAWLGLKNKPKVLEYTWIDTFVFILNWWPVTLLLFMTALACMYWEMHVPGFGLPGIVSLLAFLLFFWSRFLGGTADWFEVGLFFAGILCLGIEFFVTTGTLVAGVTGALLIVASLLMAGQSGWAPDDPMELRRLALNLGALVGAGVLGTVLMALFGRRLGESVLFAPVTLQPDVEEPVVDPRRPLALGDHGVAHTALRPVGKARFFGELRDVTADGDIVHPGRAVEVVEIDGRRVVVRERST